MLSQKVRRLLALFWHPTAWLVVTHLSLLLVLDRVLTWHCFNMRFRRGTGPPPFAGAAISRIYDTVRGPAAVALVLVFVVVALEASVHARLVTRGNRGAATLLAWGVGVVLALTSLVLVLANLTIWLEPD